MAARATVFLANRTQTVRLPRAVALSDGAREVMIMQDGPHRIIVPADATWDDFFQAPGVGLGHRQQPEAQQRDTL